MHALKGGVVGIVVSLSVSQWAAAQDVASDIVGVWKAIDITRKETGSGKTEKPYGDKPTAYFIYTKGGNFSWIQVAEVRQKPAGPVASGPERIALFDSMSFGTGTYKVAGNKVVYRYDSSWHQAWTGTERISPLPEINGKRMINTSAPFKHPVSGADAVVVQTFERIE